MHILMYDDADKVLCEMVLPFDDAHAMLAAMEDEAGRPEN
jgi:hypothetical protein